MNIHFIFSSPPENEGVRKALLAELVALARNPDPGSHFDRMTAEIRHLPDEPFLDALCDRGYEVAIALDRDGVVGILAHHRHKTEWHCFYYRTMPKWRGHGVASILLRHVVEEALKRGIASVIVWGEDQLKALDPDNRARMEKIYKNAAENKFGIKHCLIRRGTRPGEITLRALAAA